MKMKPISSYRTKKSYLLTAIVALFTITSLALPKGESQDYINYVKSTKQKLKPMVDKANKYKRDSIDYYQRQLNAIIDEEPDIEQDAAKIESLKQEFNILVQDTATKNAQLKQLKQTIDEAKNNQELEDKIEEYVVNLFQIQCNPSAIESLDNFDIFLSKEYLKGFKKDRELLKKYPEYSLSLKTPLDSVYREINRTGWTKQEEGSEILEYFDKLWKDVKYLKKVGKKGESILFLDQTVKRIEDMRNCGFDGQKEEFNDIRSILTPKDSPRITPIDDLYEAKVQYDRLNGEVEKDKQRLKQINKEIDNIQDIIEKSTKDDVEFGRLDSIIVHNKKEWFAMRKEIDTEILNYCELCLSEPADELGDNFKLREAVKKELMDFAQSDATKKKVETYKVLFDNYYDYTMEIRELLKKYISLRKADGRDLKEQKNPAVNALHNLQYWDYYKNRNNKDAVSSPHLDRILAKYESWLDSNFKGVSLQEYNKLGQDLMGIKKNKPTAEDEQTEKLLNELGNRLNNSDDEGFETNDDEVNETQVKADKEAQKAQEKAEKEAKNAEQKAKEAQERAEEEAQEAEKDAQKAQEKADKEAQKAQEKAEKDAKKAQDKANRERQQQLEREEKARQNSINEAMKAQEKADKEALKAKEKAEKDAKKAQEKVDRERQNEAKKAQEKADKEAQKAQEEAEKARKLAEKAEKEAEEARKKAEKAKQKAENDDTEESDEGTTIMPIP